MTLEELLNADVAVIGRLLREGLAWWGRELAELVPPALRARPARSARWLAQMSGEDGSVRLWRGGAPVEVLDTPHDVGLGATLRRADLMLPAGAVLTRDLELPRLSAGDLRRLMTLNLDRFTPFSAERAYFDTVVLERAADGATQRVRLGVIGRANGRAALERAGELGLKAERLGVASGPDGSGFQFDFMPAVRAVEGGDPTRRRLAYLWAACAVLVGLNLAAVVVRDMHDVNRLQGLVDVQQPAVTLALKLRKTVEAEQARRIDLLQRRAADEPLRIIDAATKVLPPGQWVQRLEWNGRAVRLVGFKQPGFDVLAALRATPALRRPRSLLSEAPQRTPSGQEPFDVMADATGADATGADATGAGSATTAPRFSAPVLR